MKPITPGEIAEHKSTIIPPEVIKVFNDLIAENYSGGSAKVIQHIAVDRIIEATGVYRQTIFDKGWLNVEEVFRAAGWDVEYDKPAYNESYDAYFTFRG